MVRCNGGGIMWSSVATRYQLGHQAGSLTWPLRVLDAPRDLTGKFLALPGPGAKERSLSPSDDRTTDEIPQKHSPRAPPRPSVGCELGHIATGAPYLRERLLPVGRFAWARSNQKGYANASADIHRSGKGGIGEGP